MSLIISLAILAIIGEGAARLLPQPLRAMWVAIWNPLKHLARDILSWAWNSIRNLWARAATRFPLQTVIVTVLLIVFLFFWLIVGIFDSNEAKSAVYQNRQPDNECQNMWRNSGLHQLPTEEFALVARELLTAGDTSQVMTMFSGEDIRLRINPEVDMIIIKGNDEQIYLPAGEHYNFGIYPVSWRVIVLKNTEVSLWKRNNGKDIVR